MLFGKRNIRVKGHGYRVVYKKMKVKSVESVGRIKDKNRME